jgi:gluconolactonase
LKNIADVRLRRLKFVIAGPILSGLALPLIVSAQDNNIATAESASAIVALDRSQIDSLLASPDTVIFIDLRRAEEIAANGGLPVYLNIQLSELDRFLPYIPRNRSVVTISNRGHRAQAGAALLALSGFTVLGAVGALDYQDQGGTLYGRRFDTPAIPGVVPAGTRVQVVREGFSATEGPIALPDGALAFTENSANRVVRIGPDGAVSTLVPNAGGPNALAINAQGAIVAVQTANPSSIAVIAPYTQVLASAYSGRPFNRINDLALARTGDIYFTDPGVVPPSPAGQPRIQPETGLYHLAPDGSVTLVASNIRRPNGVVLSPDELTLYVADSWGRDLLAYSVATDGGLSNPRPFARLAGFADLPEGPTSGADGIAVDSEGRVYVATRAGVEVFSAGGDALGVIALPKQPQNLAFAGPDRSILYVVGRGSVFRIPTQTHGVDRLGK